MLPEERHFYLLQSAAQHWNVLAGSVWDSSENTNTGSAWIKFQHGNPAVYSPNTKPRAPAPDNSVKSLRAEFVSELMKGLRGAVYPSDH